MNRERIKPEMTWVSETEYWIKHPKEFEKNLMYGLMCVRWMKDNNATEKEAADHFGINEKEFHKIIHGQIPPKNL